MNVAICIGCRIEMEVPSRIKNTIEDLQSLASDLNLTHIPIYCDIRLGRYRRYIMDQSILPPLKENIITLKK